MLRASSALPLELLRILQSCKPECPNPLSRSRPLAGEGEPERCGCPSPLSRLRTLAGEGLGVRGARARGRTGLILETPRGPSRVGGRGHIAAYAAPRAPPALALDADQIRCRRTLASVVEHLAHG